MALRLLNTIKLISVSLICGCFLHACDYISERNTSSYQNSKQALFKFEKSPADQVININTMVYDAHPASIGIDWNAKDRVPYPCDSLFNTCGIYYDIEFECWRLSEQARKEFERKEQEEFEAYKKTENYKNVAKAAGVITEPEQSSHNREKEVMNSSEDEFPVLERPKAVVPPKEQPIENPQPTVSNRAIYKGSNNPQSGGSEGITSQPGDQGKPNGVADIKQYDGKGGKGNGIGYDLGGRGCKNLPKPPQDFPEEGHIVVEIWIDREGQVIRAEISPKGTTIVNNDMRQSAIQAAKRSIFNADPDAPEEQHGTITYTFVINQ